jgi:hypothetical protein
VWLGSDRPTGMSVPMPVSAKGKSGRDNGTSQNGHSEAHVTGTCMPCTHGIPHGGWKPHGAASHLPLGTHSPRAH